MCEMEKYKGHLAALGIVYFSCDDIEGEADEVYNRISSKWATNTVVRAWLVAAADLGISVDPVSSIME